MLHTYKIDYRKLRMSKALKERQVEEQADYTGATSLFTCLQEGSLQIVLVILQISETRT